jgi:hypothetical protein
VGVVGTPSLSKHLDQRLWVESLGGRLSLSTSIDFVSIARRSALPPVVESSLAIVDNATYPMVVSG